MVEKLLQFYSFDTRENKEECQQVIDTFCFKEVLLCSGLSQEEVTTAKNNLNKATFRRNLKDRKRSKFLRDAQDYETERTYKKPSLNYTGRAGARFYPPNSGSSSNSSSNCFRSIDMQINQTYISKKNTKPTRGGFQRKN